MSAEDRVPPRQYELADTLETLSRRVRDTNDHVGNFAIHEASFVVLDVNDTVRVRLGLQTDGTYGIKIYEGSGTLSFSQTTP